MDDPRGIVETPWGPARVAFVDQWLAVSADGELLERDVWEVTWVASGIEVAERVHTLPEPDTDALQRLAAYLRRREVDSHQRR